VVGDRQAAAAECLSQRVHVGDGAKAALAGDQDVDVLFLPDDERVHQADGLDALSEFVQSFQVELSPLAILGNEEISGGDDFHDTTSSLPLLSLKMCI
jgi:hypothetical protein